MYWLTLAALGYGAWWLLKPSYGSGGGKARRFGPAPAGVDPNGGIAVADDCSWIVESPRFLPPLGSTLYSRPIGTASSVRDSMQTYGSAWGFVMGLLAQGATTDEAAGVLILEAPVDLTTNAQHCGQVTALSPAMVAWRTSLAERIAAEAG